MAAAAAGWHTKRNYTGNGNNTNLNDTQSPSSYSNFFRQSFEQEVASELPLQTPQPQLDRASRARGINAPRIRPSVRDVFDNSSPESRGRSNSNGLSWSPNHASNSVVDNMLLSLDNIQPKRISSLPYSTNSSTIPRERGLSTHSSPSRGHSISSVSSSDYGSTYDSPPRHIPRHRSNSTANYQSSLGRINSVRVTGQEEDSRQGQLYPPTRGRGTGIDSGSSSLELERPESKYKANRRSQSFDHGYLRMAFRSGLQDPFVRDNSDATILPSVPVNPRTQPLIAPLPSNVNGNLLSTNSHRRGSNRSSIRPILLAENQPSNMQPPASWESGSIANASEKSASVYTPTLVPKENQRPGFFRRMFGSSGGPSQREETIQQKRNLQRPAQSISSVPSEDTADLQPPQSSQRIPMKDKSLKDSQQLNKKTSFFRRRRKSVQETPIPQLPQVAPDKDEHTACPDSPGSLQKVMDQYYANHKRMESKGSIATTRRNNSLQTGGMLATIRHVGGTSAETNIEPSLTATSQVPSDQDKIIKNTKDIEHRRSMSGGSKLDSRDNVKPSPNDRSKHSPSHTRTQSDIDKNLPRLPIDYSAVKSSATKEIPTSRYNSNAAKATTREPSASRATTISAPLTPTKPGSAGKAQIDTPPSQDIRSEPVSEAKTTVPNAEARATPTEDRATESDELADETKEAMLLSVQGIDGPTQEQRDCARKLYDGTFGIDRSEVAPWLGEADPERSNIREAYMELFDWKDMSILSALRSFCSHIQVKGETQQVDRLLDALSRRWCDCNPRHGFKATDVVHTICYSILLLNTDLHMADIESKMTRNQFIKNTIPTIKRVVIDAAPHAFDNARSSMLPPPRRLTEPTINSSGLSAEYATETDGRPVHRLQNRPSDHSGYETNYDNDDCGPLVKSSFYGKIGAWETQVEVVLKNFYNSIRNQRLPLSSVDEDKRIDPQQSNLSLAATTNGILRRTNSLLSKAGSETIPTRGRMSESRLGGRWTSKVRSRPRLYPASLAQSRTSIDDDQSAISPSMSSMWSKHSLGKTSMSVTSFASGFPHAEYQRSIGFANALSQAITRSDSADESTEDLLRTGPLLEDESLELEGAPWAKEGILKHKHHLEAVDRKAKDRNWNECFAVIEKGWIRLFQFNMNSKSVRQRSQRMMGGGAVGGGNWMESAQSLGHFPLRHTIASALPPPGYSKARPHVWALSLPTGAVHLFQAGTPEIIREFVSTANYWSARLSKEPLIGGISNVEYGWSERVINMALVEDSRPPSTVPGSRPSMSQSIRTSLDQASTRAKLPGDKITIADWTPPPQSMMASQLLEVDQLHALQIYVQNIEEELRKHNEFRSAMLLAFTPRQSNHVKAMTNWEKKSSYLLREIVKFSTYLESLQFAQKEIERVKAEREIREEERKQHQQNGIHELDATAPVELEARSAQSRGKDSVTA